MTIQDEIHRTEIRGLLGMILLKPELAPRVFSLLHPQAIEGPERHVADAMRRLVAAGKPADVVLVRDDLARDGTLELVGGAHGLSLLFDYAHPGVESCVKRLNERARKRDIERLGDQISAEAASPESIDDVLDSAESRIRALRQASDEGGEFTLTSELSQREVPSRTRSCGTGIPRLDEPLGGGFSPGALYVIGARPGVGKTSLAVGFADHYARQGLTVAYAALEESWPAMMQRFAARRGVTLAEAATRGPYAQQAWESVGELPIAIWRPENGKISTLRAALMRLKSKPDLVIVDYLQLLRDESDRESRREEVDRIAHGLVNIASEFAVPLLAPAQLNRGPDEQSKRRPPRASDLRESGGIEANAEVVMLLHRPDPQSREAELIVDKNRFGPQAWIPLVFDGPHGAFYQRDPGNNLVAEVESAW